MAHPGGRPRKYNQKQIKEIISKFRKYIDAHDIPIVSEFAYQNDIVREELYKYEEFSTILKRCTQKKESALELMALNGKVNATMAIFSLKQLGWRDKQDVEHTGKDGAALVFTIVDPRKSQK